MSMKYFGPLRVLQCIGSMAYRLELLEDLCIHPIFHVSILKKFVSSSTIDEILPLPLVTLETGPLIQPKFFLRDHIVLRHNRRI